MEEKERVRELMLKMCQDYDWWLIEEAFRWALVQLEDMDFEKKYGEKFDYSK